MISIGRGSKTGGGPEIGDCPGPPVGLRRPCLRHNFMFEPETFPLTTPVLPHAWAKSLKAKVSGHGICESIFLINNN